MLFLYNIPAWAMGALIVFPTLAVALGGYALFRRCFPITLDAEQRSMTLAMMGAVTTINSLLVAFSAISVWGSYQAAADIVAAEAACATELAHDLAAFTHPSAAVARRELVAYLEHVVHDEWPSMQQEAHPDTRTEAVFNRMFATANRITPSDDRERALLSEVLARVRAITLGLAFFFVLAVDRPFAGEVSVSSAPIERALKAVSEEEALLNAPPG